MKKFEGFEGNEGEPIKVHEPDVPAGGNENISLKVEYIKKGRKQFAEEISALMSKHGGIFLMTEQDKHDFIQKLVIKLHKETSEPDTD